MDRNVSKEKDGPTVNPVAAEIARQRHELHLRNARQQLIYGAGCADFVGARKQHMDALALVDSIDDLIAAAAEWTVG